MNKKPLCLPYLRDAFKNFLREKLTAGKAVPTLQEAFSGMQGIQMGDKSKSLRVLCNSLGITREEFFQRFLEPWRELSREQAITVATYMNLAFIPEKSLLLEAIPVNEHRALQWTLVNIHELNLFDVFLPDYEAELSKRESDLITEAFIAPEYALPYRQCNHCGRLDSDPRDHAFGKKQLRFCHVIGCQSASSDPRDHKTGCCFKIWRPLRINIKELLKEHRDNPKKVTQHFLKFCEERFDKNLKIQTPVRVQKEKPREWATPSDVLSFTVHEDGKNKFKKTGLPLY